MKISKTLFLVGIILTISAASKAQTGSWYVGGNVGFSSSQSKLSVGSTSDNTGKKSGWSFSPEIGTFLTDHIQLGLGLTFSGSKNNDQQFPETVVTTNSYGGTLYSRYFFGKDAFKPFVGVNVSALPGKSKTAYGNTSTESKTFDFRSNINAGFGYALSKKVTAVGSFGFLGFESNTEKMSGGAKSTTRSFGLDAGTLGNRFTVGIYYTL
ncbi:MAG: outer membrane beta-barrel protein [Bacteroidota bacterium]